MTRSTVIFHTKSGVVIVAFPAGKALFHSLHTNDIAVRFCLENFGMTFVTAIHLGMNLMTEGGIANISRFHRHINSFNVTGHTIPLNPESSVSIVAGTAGFTLLHSLHANLISVGFRHKGIRMAFAASKHLIMYFMTKRNAADILGLHGDINSIDMAGRAITLDSKSGVAIVAGTT